MAFYPGAGVGGHCIPCDPHYLLENLRGASARRADPGACDAGDRRAATQGRRARAASCSPVRRASAERRAGAGGRRLLQAGRDGRARVARARDHPRAARDAGAEVALPRPARARRSRSTTAVPLLSVAAAEPRRLRPRGRRDDPPGSRLRAGCDDCAHVLDCTYRTPGGMQPERHLMASFAAGTRLAAGAAQVGLQLRTAGDLRRLPGRDHRRHHRLQGRVHRGHLLGPVLRRLQHRRLRLHPEPLRVQPRSTGSHPDAGLEPSVAIVMPAFNEEQAIANSVRSLLARRLSGGAARAGRRERRLHRRHARTRSRRWPPASRACA